MLSESVPEIIWTARPDGEVSRLNSRWYEYTGIPPGKGQDEILQLTVHPEDLARARKSWAQAVATGEPYQVEQRLRRRDGEYHWFLSRAAPLRNELGAIDRWLGTATDIEDLKRSIENLTAERALRESFVSTLSHDLRSPLTAARTSAQLILRYPDRQDNHPVLAHRIIQSVSRADRMITDLLDANRIRAGQKIPLELERRDLSAIARETVDELTTIHGEHFVLSCEPEIEAFTSGEGFRRVLENLVSNAVKYGDLRRPIEITLRRDSGQVVLSVTNQGNAIRPEDQARLFEPFERSEAAKRSGKKGWGIGLALCRGIAEALGGSIALRSADGQGTTFTVRLPADSRPAQAA